MTMSKTALQISSDKYVTYEVQPSGGGGEFNNGSIALAENISE